MYYVVSNFRRSCFWGLVEMYTGDCLMILAVKYVYGRENVFVMCNSYESSAYFLYIFFSLEKISTFPVLLLKQ